MYSRDKSLYQFHLKISMSDRENKNGAVKYLPKQPIQTPQLIHAKLFYLTVCASTDGQGDSSIFPP